MRTKSKKVAGYSNATLHAKRDTKRRAAEFRQVDWDMLTSAQKMESLRIRRGDSVRQLLRLKGKL